MADFRGINFPEPVGNPPRWNDMEYDVASPLLPLESQLVEHFFGKTTHKFEKKISDLKVYGRQHTVVGHYTEFSPEPRDVPANAQDSHKEEATFFVTDVKHPFGAIFYIYWGSLNSIEIYQLGQDFPPDGITRSITAITFDDPNNSDWQESIST